MAPTAWQLVSKSLGVAPVFSGAANGRPAFHVERYFFQAKRQQIPALPTSTLAVHVGGARVSGGNTSGTVSSFIPGFSVLLPPGCSSEWFFDGPVDAVMLYFTDVSSAETKKLLKRMNDGTTIYSFIDGLVSAAAINLAGELGRGQRVNAVFVRKLGSIIADQIERVLDGHSGKQISPDRLQLGRLSTVLDWISKNLKQPITSSLLASKVGLSESHFRQLFGKALGMSPNRYVQQQRIEHAHRLLADTNLPIAYVASESGFVSQSYLTTCFRASYGITPAMLRRAMR